MLTPKEEENLRVKARLLLPRQRMAKLGFNLGA